MRTHGGESFSGIEDLPIVALFRRIDDGPFLVEVVHPLLGEGCPDDVTGEVLQCCFFFRKDAFTAEDMETGVAPSRE